MIIFILSGCGRKTDGLRNYENGQNNKLFLINYINGCTNSSSKKVKGVFTHLINNKRFKYNPETDLVVFTNFNTLLNPKLSENEDFGIIQTTPTRYQTLDDFLNAALKYIKLSYPSQAQPSEAIPLMQYLAFERLLATSSHDNFTRKQFNYIEIINISSYFNQPSEPQWHTIDLSRRKLKSLIPITFPFIKMEEKLAGFTYENPVDTLGYTVNTSAFYASEVPQLSNEKDLPQAFMAMLDFHISGDTVLITPNGRLFQRHAETIGIVKINTIYAPEQLSVKYLRQQDNNSFSITIPKIKGRQKIGIEALIKINTDDPLLGNHTLYASTNPVILSVGPGLWPVIKKNILLILASIVGLIMLLILGKVFAILFSRLKAPIWIKIKWVGSKLMELSIFTLFYIIEFIEFVLGLFFTSFQKHCILKDSYGNSFLFNIHYLKRSSNHISLHLIKSNNSYSLLTDSSAVEVIKPKIINSGSSPKTSIKYKLSVLEINRKFYLPPLLSAKAVFQSEYNLFNDELEYGNKIKVSLKGSSRKYAQIVLAVYYHEGEDKSVNGIENISSKKANEMAISELVMLHNIIQPGLAFKSVTVNIQSEERIIVSYTEATNLLTEAAPDPYSLSIPLSLDFTISDFSGPHRKFVRKIRRLMNTTGTRNLFLISDPGHTETDVVINKLVNDRWIKRKTKLTLSRNGLKGNNPLIRVSTRPTPYYIMAVSYYLPFIRMELRNPLKEDDAAKILGKFHIFGFDHHWKLVLLLSTNNQALAKAGHQKQKKSIDKLILNPKFERFNNPTNSDDYPLNDLL